MKWGKKALTAVSGKSKAEVFVISKPQAKPGVQGKHTLARTWGLANLTYSDPQTNAQVGGPVRCSLKWVQRALGTCCSH